MKPLKWGEFAWNDPNVRWGSPASYRLEPGDPGYVPPASPVTPKQTKKMKRQRWFPTKLADQVAWLINYKNTLPTYAAALGLTAAQVTAAQADCGWLIYVLQTWLNAVRNFSLICTQSAQLAQSGTPNGTMTLPGFTAPGLPTGVTAQTAGALDRIFALVQAIKNDGKSNPEIETALKIAGSDATGPDLGTIQPKFTVEIVGNKVIVHWNWGGFSSDLDALELQVDRNDGKGFGFLTIDTTPGYTDTQPFPAARTVWSYRAIYRVGDAQVGVWSDVVSIAVAA
jgi:hypothetical protein